MFDESCRDQAYKLCWVLTAIKLNNQYYFTRKESYFKIEQLIYRMENLLLAINALND